MADYDDPNVCGDESASDDETASSSSKCCEPKCCCNLRGGSWAVCCITLSLILCVVLAAGAIYFFLTETSDGREDDVDAYNEFVAGWSATNRAKFSGATFNVTSATWGRDLYSTKPLSVSCGAVTTPETLANDEDPDELALYDALRYSCEIMWGEGENELPSDLTGSANNPVTFSLGVESDTFSDPITIDSFYFARSFDSDLTLAACLAAGGVWHGDADLGESTLAQCDTCKTLQKMCVKLKRDAYGKLVEDDAYGDVGCEWGTAGGWNPNTYSSDCSLTKLEVMFRSSDDPQVYASKETKGSMDFGEYASRVSDYGLYAAVGFFVPCCCIFLYLAITKVRTVTYAVNSDSEDSDEEQQAAKGNALPEQIPMEDQSPAFR